MPYLCHIVQQPIDTVGCIVVYSFCMRIMQTIVRTIATMNVTIVCYNTIVQTIVCYNNVVAIWLATAYSCIWAELGLLLSITMNAIIQGVK